MKIFPILLLVFICNNLIAQVKLTANHLIEFKGIIQDSLSNEVIPSANISFYQNNQIVRRTVTDNNGEFNVWLPQGNYFYTVSCVGFNTKNGTTDSTFQYNKRFKINIKRTFLPIPKKETNRIIASFLPHDTITSFGTRDITICNFGITWKPHKWLVINPSNYMRGPFLVPPKEKK